MINFGKTLRKVFYSSSIMLTFSTLLLTPQPAMSQEDRENTGRGSLPYTTRDGQRPGNQNGIRWDQINEVDAGFTLIAGGAASYDGAKLGWNLFKMGLAYYGYITPSENSTFVDGEHHFPSSEAAPSLFPITESQAFVYYIHGIIFLAYTLYVILRVDHFQRYENSHSHHS